MTTNISPSAVAISGLGEASDRAYDTGVEQVALVDEELLKGLGIELLALIDKSGVARNGVFIVSKAIRTASISNLTTGEFGQELVHRLEAGVNSTESASNGGMLWTPRSFSVNQYEVGDSISPHNDCLLQGLLGRAEVRLGFAEESEEFTMASEDVYAEFTAINRNPYSHDYILQVLGRKTLKYWPGDKLYRNPMSQKELGEATEIETNPGHLTIVRREVLGDDKLPVTHSVPPVLEDGLSLVIF